MNALGGRTGLILDLPPPIESLYTAQQYIERRLDSKWLPLFLSTPQFAERQRLSLGMSHVVDDAIMQRRRRALTIQKVIGNKFIYRYKYLFTRRTLITRIFADIDIYVSL